MKKTTDLLNELNKCANIDKYFKKNEKSFIDQNLSTYFCQIFEERSLSKADVVRNSDLNKVYAYQVLAGKKSPSRNKVIRLCIGADFSVEDTNLALRIAGFSALYPKLGRDSIIIYGINKKFQIWQINEELYKHEYETI